MKISFKSGDIIKIPGKGFDDLSLSELALMIEADSSISPEGNEYFASCALDEFLYNASLSRSDLKLIRKDILKNIYLQIEGSEVKNINTEYLVRLASDLRQGKIGDRPGTDSN